MSKEATTHNYPPPTVVWDPQKLEEAKGLQRGMENDSEEERSAEKATSEKNSMNDDVTEDEEGIKSILQDGLAEKGKKKIQQGGNKKNNNNRGTDKGENTSDINL